MPRSLPQLQLPAAFTLRATRATWLTFSSLISRFWSRHTIFSPSPVSLSIPRCRRIKHRILTCKSHPHPQDSSTMAPAQASDPEVDSTFELCWALSLATKLPS